MKLKRSAECAAASITTAWLLTGCSAVAGIFKAGVWVGVVAVVLGIALAVLSTSLLRR